MIVSDQTYEDLQGSGLANKNNPPWPLCQFSPIRDFYVAHILIFKCDWLFTGTRKSEKVVVFIF